MKRDTINILVFIFLLLSFSAYADSHSGGEIYRQHCGRCHNYRGPAERDDREWSIVVAHMRSTGMLTGRQEREVLEFLRQSNNPASLAPFLEGIQISSGKELFETSLCIGCHVFKGSGGIVGPSLDTVFERRSVDYVRTQIENPKKNNPASIMPVFSFSKEQIDALIEFLQK